VAHIVTHFPAYKAEIEALFAEVVKLKEQGKKLNPRPNLLHETLKRLDTVGVTTTSNDRYINRGYTKGRASIPLITNLKYAMTTTWKIAIPVGLVAIAALVMFTTLKPGAPTTPTNQGSLTQDTSGTPQAPTTPATSDFDEIAGEFSASAEAEIAAFTEMLNADADLVAYDSQELISFEQSYDANSF
jgi:hypothetical protein